MAGTIIYYVVSPVHVRNVQLLAPELSRWDLRIAYEEGSPWLNAENMAPLPFDKIALPAERVPELLWEGEVKGVVLSTAQPRQVPINLVRAALERGVPSIAIEESNQIALNQGTVNNYVLPVDYVLTASEHECRGMIEAGFPARRFEVTGWPFYAGRVGRISVEQRRARKKMLGLDPERPVASLTLTGLNDAGESPVVRRRQLSLAAQGLPPEYQMVVKPHPIEKREVLMPFVRECAPHATVIEGMVRAEELIEATDVLLNRGVSQVCIEALFQEIPVIVLDTDIQTPFHGLAQDLIVEKPEDLGRILGSLVHEKEPMALYKSFRENHVPFSPVEARTYTCRRIEEIVHLGKCDPEWGKRWFDLALFQAWRLDRCIALDMVDREEVSQAGCPAEEFKRLMHYQATVSDLEVLKCFLGDGFHGHLLRCLWIDQLEHTRKRSTEVDQKWMADFPPLLDAVWFVLHARKWVFVLLRSGYREQAVEFTRNMRERFIHVPGVIDLVSEVDTYLRSLFGRTCVVLKYQARKVLRPVKQHVERFLK